MQNSQALSVGNDSPELPVVPLEKESKDPLLWNTVMSGGLNWMREEMDSVRKSFSDDSSSSLGTDVIKPAWEPERDLAWWPSKVDRFLVRKDISKEKEGSVILRENLQDNKKTWRRRMSKQPSTFEELENWNANIYNPLLNLDHYPIPAKKYTVIELENMNANHYNPYL